MKRVWFLWEFLAASVLMLVLLSSCRENGTSDSETEADTTPAETTTETPVTTERQPTEEELLAYEMVDVIFEQYAVEGGKGEDAYINFTEYHNTPQMGYLWTNFSAVGMQYYVCKLDPDDEEQKEIFRKMVNNFKYFRQLDPSSNSAENSVKYHSARGVRVGGGAGDCFFDDNIWVARNYLRAYEILGDEWYLDEAIRVNNWVLSGWDQELGGLVWNERGLTDSASEQNLERGLSANACGIIVNAMLSRLVEDEAQKSFYSEWAEKFYTFCKKMQNKPTSFDYWNGIHTLIVDGVRKDGAINRVHFAYNSGSMILADLIMYDCTDDETKKQDYLADAIGTAAAAHKTFYVTDSVTGAPYYQGDPWFAAILHEAYYELSHYDPNSAIRYLEAFSANVTLAHSNRDEATDLLPYQAPFAVTWDKNESWGIHQIGFAEQAVLAALYSVERQESEA